MNPEFMFSLQVWNLVITLRLTEAASTQVPSWKDLQTGPLTFRYSVMTFRYTHILSLRYAGDRLNPRTK